MAKEKFDDILGIEILDEFHDVPSIANDTYRELLPDITKAVVRSYNEQRKAAKKISDVVFDGNISEDGVSSNPNISEIQKKVNEIATRLADEHKLCQLNEKAVNVILSGALTVPEVEETFYQTIRLSDNGTAVSQKIYNIIFHPSYLFSLLKNSYLIGKTVVECDIVSFIWAILDFVVSTSQASKIEITPKQVTVLIYLSKYATNKISESEIKEKIEKHTLDINDFGDYTYTELTPNEVSEILNQLMKLRIVTIDEGIISLAEKILL